MKIIITLLLILILTGCMNFNIDNNQICTKGFGIMTTTYPIVSFNIGFFERKIIIKK